MRRLTFKIIILTALSMMLAGWIPNLLWLLFGGQVRPENVTPKMILFAGFSTVLFALILFSIIIDRLILKRLTKINRATNEVSKGNYDVVIKDIKSNDEITDVMLGFNQMTRELQSNEYLNKEFVRNFSHELKTPLSAIKGYADLMNQRELSNEEIKEYTSIISKEADRLSSLSKNMLSISLIDSQGIIKKDDTYNLSEQIRNVIQLTQLEWEEKDIDLNIELEEVTITSNKELTYQVWTNLFSNAIKFSTIGGIVTVQLQKVDDNIIFNITNDGKIVKDDQAKVFELFFVSEQSRTDKSNGVGLTLSKKIVEKLNGTIDFNSENNKTTFSVVLPY